MNSRLRNAFLSLALVAALVGVACSDDDGPTGTGDEDTTPPGVTSVTAVDGSHIDVTFNEAVTRSTAEDTDNYSIVNVPVPYVRSRTAAGGGLSVLSASLGTNGRTVTLATSPMSTGDYRLSVSGVTDVHGNTVTEQIDKDFTGSTDADVTAPQLVHRDPGPNATGVAATKVIELTFSEPIQFSTLQAGFSMSNGGVVDVTFNSTDNTHFSGTHDPLTPNTLYDITLNGVQDPTGNTMSNLAWSFRTSGATDTTPPTLVSSVPANLATSVDVNAALSLTFSEAIDPGSFSPFFTPEVAGTGDWSVDGKTFTLTPLSPLSADTQYILLIIPGDVLDLAGNPNTQLFSRVFTTGAVLANGSIAGTISGQAGTAAADPTGAFVAAADAFPFGNDPFNVHGIAVVAGNDTYHVQYLGDGTYYPFCIKETNHDDWLDPFLGDAIGINGINLAVLDTTATPVDIVGGADVTGVNFPLYDPSAVYGEIYYEGIYSGGFHAIYVGLFNAAGFDPDNPGTPLATTEADWPNNPSYVLTELEVGPIANGNYVIGAFLDVNGNGDFDSSTEPAGVFGGDPPQSVNLSNGADAPNTSFLIEDPAPGLVAARTHWQVTPRAKWIQNLSEAIRQAQLSKK